MTAPFDLPNASPASNPAADSSAGPSSAGTPPSEPAAGGPTAEELSAERSRAERLAQQLNESQRFNQQLALQLLSRADHAAPPAPEPPAPSRDDDPDGHASWLAKKAADEVLKQKLDPLLSGYNADRQVFLESAIAFQKSSVRSSYPDFDKYQKEIDAYLGLFPPDVVARPGAIEDAYFRVKGRATAIADRENATRAAAVADVRGRGSSVGADDDVPVDKPKLTDQQLKLAAREGLSPDEWLALKANGPATRVTVEDWNAIRAARAKKKGAA